MTETYLTPTFQNAAKPQATPAPGAPAPPAAPAQTGGEQYQTPTFQNAVKPPAPPPPGGGQQTTGAAQPDWSVKGWGPGLLPQPGFGDVKLPPSAQDWGTLAAQNSLMGITGLGAPGKAQADAARARLDPAAAMSADMAGGTFSPTTALAAIPYVGPSLAGGLHEGVKSAVENWKPSESWTDYAKNVGEDTAGGAIMGLLGQRVAAASPKTLSNLTRVGVNTGLTTAAHKMFGSFFGGDLMKEGATLLGGLPSIDEAGKWAGEQVGSLAGTPAVRQAIQNLILGGGSALRQQTGAYNQWIPGQ
jgi:hypothetical protein